MIYCPKSIFFTITHLSVDIIFIRSRVIIVLNLYSLVFSKFSLSIFFLELLYFDNIVFSRSWYSFRLLYSRFVCSLYYFTGFWSFFSKTLIWIVCIWSWCYTLNKSIIFILRVHDEACISVIFKIVIINFIDVILTWTWFL